MEPLKEKSRHLKASEPFVFIPIDADENTDECPKIRTAIALKKLGNTHFENKRFIDALVCYRDAIEQLKASDKKKSAKELAICYQNSAAVLEHGKRYEECIEIATTAIELNASYAKAYYRRARCHIQLKNQYFALQDIVQACILERFQNSTYNKIAAKTNRQFESDDNKYADEAYEKMSCLERKPSHYDVEHLKLLKKSTLLDDLMVALLPNMPDTGYFLAIRGVHELSISDILAGCEEELMDDGIFSVQAAILRGFVNGISSDTLDWMRDICQMRIILQNKPHTPHHLKFYAELCLSYVQNTKGSFDRSIWDHFDVKYPNKLAHIYLIKSNCFGQMGHEKECHPALKRCCELMPDFYYPHLKKAFFEWEMDKEDANCARERLIAQLKHLVERFPMEVHTRSALCQQLIYDGRYDEAIVLLNETQRLLPNQINDTWLHQAMLCDDALLAVTYFKRAIEFNIMESMAYIELYKYYESQSHEYAKAVEVLNRGLNECRDPNCWRDMFVKRQQLLARIERQNFWDQL